MKVMQRNEELLVKVGESSLCKAHLYFYTYDIRMFHGNNQLHEVLQVYIVIQFLLILTHLLHVQNFSVDMRGLQKKV